MPHGSEAPGGTPLARRFRVTDVMQTSMDGCWIVDAEGRLVEVNDAYCVLTGFRREELVGQTISFVEAQETPEVTRAHVRRVLELGHDRFETRHRQKDGGVLDIEVSTSHLVHEADREHVFLVFLRDITERKRWEAKLRATHAEALQQSERRLYLALASVDMAVFQHDRDVRYTWMVRPQLGYTPEDVIGKTDLELLPPDDARRVVALKRRVLDTGEHLREIVPVTVGDDTHYFDLVVEPVRDPEGAVVGVAGASFDVTERVRAQRALEASETRYRVLFEKNTEAVFLLDRRTGKFVSANSAAEKLTGRRLADLVERTPGEVAPEGVRERLQQTAAANGPMEFGEIVFVRPDGTKRVAELSVVPLGDDFRIGFAHDLTDRKVEEEKLRTLSRAVERSPASIVITDAAGNIEYVNPRFAQVTGYSAQEVLGKNPRLLKSGSTSPDEYRRLWDTILAGREWRGEFQNRRKDGGLFWELASISSITDAPGAITHFVAVKEEITDRKRAEEERARIESELRQASKMEAIGQLAGGVAHDFNNMLAVILNYAEMAQSDLDPQDPLVQDFEEIIQAGRRAADLTQQLLAFSRKAPVVPRILNLNEAIASHQKMLGRLIGEDIAFHFASEPTLWNVRMDPGQIGQILINLAVNARDAMPHPGTLTVETSNVSESNTEATRSMPPGDYVRLVVRDTGTGMDAATQARIFEPFFTTKPEGRGTGLGLSTVYGIVMQNDGYIQVTSEPGRGTEFVIHLPRSVSAVAPLSLRPPGRDAGAGSETILLVEDEPQLLALAGRILERAGYVVLAAKTPGEACLLAEKHSATIRLLLSDVVMPGMGGGELQRRVERLSPRVRTIFMSGYPADIVSERGVIEPDVGFIAKPFTAQSLTDKVREVLDE